MWAPRLAAIAVFAACGNDASTAQLDAAAEDIADASPDLDATIEVLCDFTEAADGTNGTVTTAETTSLTLATRLTLCGTINTGHFEQDNPQVVDADAFKFTIAADTDVLLHITGTGLDGPEDTVIQLRQGNDFVGFGVVEGGHGTLGARLPAGEYSAAMAAFNSSALSTAVDYRLTIVHDMPNQRCPETSITPTFPEANDGASDDGNDVIDYESSANTPSTLSASTADAPEPTGITVGADPTTPYRITGSSADVNPADDYEDRDTFAFTTGPTTSQLSIRLNWAATTVDFDYRVYPVSTTDPLSIVGGLDESQSEDEFETFAVKPGTTYWLWIAAEDGASGQPAAYDATLCGATFAP